MILGLDYATFAFLAVSLLIALGFEFVNGFHDTANAVATVIYTKSMKPRTVVVLAGVCNFVGVHIGGIAVAYAIVHLLPVELLVTVNTARGMGMVFALLVGAILWNLGTWYLGLPASSSHTLIGSIVGVGLANAMIEGLNPGTAVNWTKAGEVGLSLFISPVLGFVAAAALLKLLKKVKPDPNLHRPPRGDEPPPFWTRAALLVTCFGVSLAHGSNDGQKGVGLIMLILIGILPAHYAMNLNADQSDLADARQAALKLHGYLQTHQQYLEKIMEATGLDVAKQRASGFPVECGIDHALASARNIAAALKGAASTESIGEKDRWRLRTEILCLDDAVREVLKLKDLPGNEASDLEAWSAQLREPVEYAPNWVLMAVALSLGTGTMVGWKRIVVTIGEKIGKTRLTYGQGVVSQFVAMGTIGLADGLGLPVSTTHVLSSGVAGSMSANGSGLQGSTLRSIALAWVLTLPMAMILAGGLYWLFHLVY